jgi:hypothetical protein
MPCLTLAPRPLRPRASLFAGALLAALCGATAAAAPKLEVIRLDGLVPDLPITLRESWNAIGIDPHDRAGNLYFLAFDFRGFCALPKFNVGS